MLDGCCLWHACCVLGTALRLGTQLGGRLSRGARACPGFGAYVPCPGKLRGAGQTHSAHGSVALRELAGTRGDTDPDRQWVVRGPRPQLSRPVARRRALCLRTGSSV